MLVVGGSEPAARKVELLLSAGARVTLIADTVVGEIAQLIADAPHLVGRPRLRRRRSRGHGAGRSWRPTTRRCRRACRMPPRQRCLPVNVVDRPRLSSFIMPAIVDRAPDHHRHLDRRRGAGAGAARCAPRSSAPCRPRSAGWRASPRSSASRCAARSSEPRDRRRFWDRVFAGRIGELALAGDEIAARRELIRLLDSTRNENAPAPGMVHLVGAGPGDPDLLTMKAHRLLQRADVIVYDRLVSPEVLAMARRDAERIFVGKRRAEPRPVAGGDQPAPGVAGARRQQRGAAEGRRSAGVRPRRRGDRGAGARRRCRRGRARHHRGAGLCGQSPASRSPIATTPRPASSSPASSRTAPSRSTGRCWRGRARPSSSTWAPRPCRSSPRA